MSIAERNRVYENLHRWLPRMVAYRLTVFLTR